MMTGTPDNEDFDDLRKLRTEYCQAVTSLRSIADELLGQGCTIEEVARELHRRRRDLGVKYKDLTPKPKREQIYSRNRKRYGDELGPTIEYLRDYQGKSWEQIVASAMTPNPGDIDKLLE